jgi:hypothetical protein
MLTRKERDHVMPRPRAVVPAQYDRKLDSPICVCCVDCTNQSSIGIENRVLRMGWASAQSHVEK